MNGLQKTGGVAALIMAGTWLVAFAVFLAVLAPAGYLAEGIAPAEKARIIVDNQASASIGYLLPYVLWGILQVVLSLALYERVKAGAPAMAQTATAIGLLWAGLVIASGFVATLGIRKVVDLHGTDPAQAASLWASVETVAMALGGGAGEVLGGSWLLLIGWAALRARALPRALSYLGLVLGAAGVLTVVPSLEPAGFLFGLGFIVWWVWLGIAILRGSLRAEARTPATELA